MDSLTDGQTRYIPRIDEANVLSVLKNVSSNMSYHIMFNPPALLLRGQMPTSYLAHEPSAIPTPATTVRAGKRPEIFRNRPRHTVNAPGPFHACKIIKPQRAFTRVIAVRIICVRVSLTSLACQATYLSGRGLYSLAQTKKP